MTKSTRDALYMAAITAAIVGLMLIVHFGQGPR